jgi:hypothetical protein
MEQYYAKKKDDPMFMYFFSLLNTHFGNYEKAIDDMTNTIVTLEKEHSKAFI